MQLVILAAGHGRRFGGLKQLAPVGPNGEAIMDYTALAAEACGFTGVVIVVRDEIQREVADHLERHWTIDVPVEFACQPASPPGTAQALLCTRPYVRGPFAVANADDLYGEAALRMLAEGLGSPDRSDGHVLVAYRLARTVLTRETVTRGVCEVGPDRVLRRIAEHRVRQRSDGAFDAVPLAHAGPTGAAPELDGADLTRLSGDELVSMNLWGFRPRLFDELELAVRKFDPASAPRPELLLPDVVGRLVATASDRVHVVETDNHCIGITHREDIDIVRREVAEEQARLSTLRSSRDRLE